MRLRTVLRYALATLIVLIAIALIFLELVALFGSLGSRWQTAAAVLLMAPILAYLFVMCVRVMADLLVDALKKTGEDC